MTGVENLCVCVTCGTQYDFKYDDRPECCRMCLDPRQFVPPSGHSFTTMGKLKEQGYKNLIKQDEADGRIYSIFTSPQFAIGQRAVFIQTEAGNILWDCVSLLDQDTIEFHASGLAHEFDCPVYLAAEDQEWLNRTDSETRRSFFDQETKQILPGVTIVKLGGHFPGSAVLHWNNNIFTGDTIGISLSGLSRAHHGQDHQTFFFHYAFPNFIPLGPTAMHLMWKRLRVWEFSALYSLFHHTTVRDTKTKQLVLESMQRQARHQENHDHPLQDEQW